MSASAEEDQFAPTRAFWTQYGVPAETQDALIAELLAGGTIDAFDQNAVPVSSRQHTTLEDSSTVATFSDGSILVTSRERPDRRLTSNSVTPDAVTTYLGDCSVTSGAGWVSYRGCNVEATDGIRYIGYKASYEKYSSGNAQILATWDAHVSCTYGSMTTPTVAYSRLQSTSTQSAVVKRVSTWTGTGGNSSETMYLSLWVTRAGAASVGTS
ncbi:hypothetical protein [Cellulomonas cellasea]|uniref:hypothetical protein n=1 Tax=Cellulomonas cellasea TaxID=43670 RepID=UPI000B2BC9DB|nr:hypothetical protein [Cellulomonas cellasea]